jgi:hypothetical protein
MKKFVLPNFRRYTDFEKLTNIGYHAILLHMRISLHDTPELFQLAVPPCFWQRTAENSERTARALAVLSFAEPLAAQDSRLKRDVDG